MHWPTRLPRPSFARLYRRVGVALALTLAVAGTAHPAGAAEEEDEHYDARVQGYTPEAEAKSSSVGLTWVLLILLGGACVSVMFIDAKRTHLD